ncbi:MAG: glycosyl hydrolase [Spirochaetia bacterium]
MKTKGEDPLFFKTNKPYVRWWWFNQRIDTGDLDRQLRWVSRQGFGGVEIAWVYPLPGRPAGPRWLSPEWTALVRDAKEICSRLGLGCDFTFGSLWPFGDSALAEGETSQWFSGPSPQRIDRHWESRDLPGGPSVMNHLDRRAFESYGRRTAAALAPALAGETSCLFCDSWEAEDDGKLWTEGFGERFKDRYGYGIEPSMPCLSERPDERYDYRVVLGEYVIEEFYRPFTSLCRSLGALSRVQCHGAPTDIVAAYSEADVPESEALLFDPAFSRFAASAAALAGKEIVSCEAFTCLYGWNPWPAPGPHLGEEKIGDLKLLADALAAHGINRYIWHGMPFRAPRSEDRFYASVHVGPDGALAARMGEFNRYLEEISEFLREGRPAHRIACLVPLEDVRMKGELPDELRKPSARYWWEFQHPCLPELLRPWSPLWVTGAFLDTAQCLPDGGLRWGHATVDALVVDSLYLDGSVLERLARLSSAGARVILTRRPREPGKKKRRDYSDLVDSLTSGARTRFSSDPRPALRDVPPFLQCEEGPDFFVREDEADFIVFAAHPAARRITYPMEYGASERAIAETRHARFFGRGGRETDCTMQFAPAGSFLFRIGKQGGFGQASVKWDFQTG